MAQTATETSTETTAEGHATDGTTAGTQAHGGEHGGSTFPPLDSSTFPSQLLWLVVFFGALYYILSRVLLPKISSILETRKMRIDGDLARAQALKEETEAAIKSYEKALADARTRANDIAKDTRDNVTKDVDLEQSKVNASLGQKISQAEARIAASKATAMASVGSIAEEATAEIMAALTGSKLAKADIAKAVAAVAK